VMDEGWSTYPNLRMGANSSRNRGRGRLQVQVRRAFLAAGSDELTTSQVYDYALPRVRADLWRQMQRCSACARLAKRKPPRALARKPGGAGRLAQPGQPTTPPGSRGKWTANSPCPNLHRCKSSRRRRTNNALELVSAEIDSGTVGNLAS
jgi:hypothetical protein